MKKFAVIICMHVVMLFPNTSLAGTDFYTCKLEDYASTWFNNETANKYLKMLSETDIFVNRKTGEVWHTGLGNTAFDKRTLIHKGDTDNAFKVISSSENGWSAHYMIIQSYSENIEKPFRIVDGTTVWLGTCK